MMWALIILIGLFAIPFTVELMRDGRLERSRKAAPGQFALLSQGVTHYQWIGPERGPVALCIHGLTTPSYVWHGMAKGLALMGFRVLIYDLYGRGYSDRTTGKQNAAFFLKQLDDLLLHEHVEGPVTVFGYSMGGSVATHFTASNPGFVKQLVLLAPAGMQHMVSRMATFVRNAPLIGDWMFLLVYPRNLRRHIQAEAHMPSSVENITALQQAETDKHGFFPAVLSSFRGILRYTTEAQHKAIAAADVPVLVLWGKQDEVIALTAADILSDWNPNAVQAVIGEAGHGLPYTHTDEILRALKATCS